MGRFLAMNQDTPTPEETGAELIQLINETVEATGMDAVELAQILSQTTGISFNILGGKLNITEDALKALDWKMAYARAKCKEIELAHKHSGQIAPKELKEQIVNAGYIIPSFLEEQDIRKRYYRSNGHYRDRNNPIWNDLRAATGSRTFSLEEVASFVWGKSVSDLFANRRANGGKVHVPVRTVPVKRTNPRELTPGLEPKSLVDTFFDIPGYVWIGGFIFFIWLLATISPPGDRNFALERAEEKARNGRASEMTEKEAEAFRKKQEADSIAHRKNVLGY